MTGRGINTVRIGDEVKHIAELDALGKVRTSS